MNGGVIIPDKETAKALNDLARHKAIVRLLADIRIDLEICELEGWDKTEYINRLKALLNSIGSERGVTMGQLRRLKRQFERDSRKKSMKELYEHCDRVSEQQERELREEYKKAAIDQDVKNMVYAMYYLFGVHLHDDFGFGGKRLLRLFESVDREIATWASGGITTGQLQQKLFDTTGIDLRLDGIDFRKETA